MRESKDMDSVTHLTWTLLCFLIMILVITFALEHGVLGHEAGDRDADWYNSLRDRAGVSCCSASHDCHIAIEYKAGAEPGSYWVLSNGEWVYAPAYSVLKRADNPTGLPVVCVWYQNAQPVARCLVLPAEG